MSTILVVDDEVSMLEVLSEMLSREGYAVQTTPEAEAAVGLVERGGIDLVISDLKMEPLDGLGLLRRLKRVEPEVVVIVMTAYASYETAVEAMREGALEYVMKPFKRDEILLKVKLGLQQRAILDENRMLKREIAGRYEYENIVGTSKPMQAIYRLIEKADVVTLTEPEWEAARQLGDAMVWMGQNPYAQLRPGELKRWVVKVSDAAQHGESVSLDE